MTVQPSLAAIRAALVEARNTTDYQIGSPAALDHLVVHIIGLIDAIDGTWRKVVYAADCEGDPDDVLICPHCGIDYAECPCPGPHQDDEYDYEQRVDGLYARKRA